MLLSHSLICSTIAAGVLNLRVREGNECDYPAMDTGKYIYQADKLFNFLIKFLFNFYQHLHHSAALQTDDIHCSLHFCALINGQKKELMW